MQILIKNAIIASNGIKYDTKRDILIKNGVIKKIEHHIDIDIDIDADINMNIEDVNIENINIENIEDATNLITEEIKGSVAKDYLDNKYIKTISVTNTNRSTNKSSKFDKIIDANFKIVMPGFIDLECKTSQTGYENKNNMRNLTRAAVKGGYTTLVTSPKNKPIVDNKAVVEYVYSKCKDKNYINLFPIAGCTKNNEGIEISEIGDMHLAGAVAVSDADTSISDTILLRDIFLYSKMFDLTVITSGLEPNLTKCGMVHYGYMSTKLGLKGIPYEAEVMEVSRKAILANYTGAKIHIPYITSAGSIDVIKKAKSDGTNITCSTSPHYFTLTHENIENYNTLAKVMPPLREENDLVKLKDAIRDGTIDFITSGHSPVLFENKDLEFQRAEFGISSIDTVFSLTYTKLVKEFEEDLELEEKDKDKDKEKDKEKEKDSNVVLAEIENKENKSVIQKYSNKYGIEALSLLLSKRVAQLLNFDKKGEIAIGFDADIVILDETIEYVIDSSKFYSRAKFSPYDGRKVFGKVLLTMVSGNVLYDINSEIVKVSDV